MSDEYNAETVGGVEYKYSSGWINKLEEKQHWEYYWYQQKLLEGLVVPGRDELLEVGKGSGFAANYCKSKGINVTTLDIDEGKSPDIVANVVTYDFKRKYDHLMAFEILEHIPYAEFEKIILRLPSIIEKYAFVSLPRNEHSLVALRMKLPQLRWLNFDLRVLKKRITCEAHHWEMDFEKYTTERVEGLFASAGLQIERKMRCNHIRFYALKKCAP